MIILNVHVDASISLMNRVALQQGQSRLSCLVLDGLTMECLLLIPLRDKNDIFH